MGMLGEMPSRLKQTKVALHCVSAKYKEKMWK
jgi:hypothetical protein